jgi:hypothetical protein
VSRAIRIASWMVRANSCGVLFSPVSLAIVGLKDTSDPDPRHGYFFAASAELGEGVRAASVIARTFRMARIRTEQESSSAPDSSGDRCETDRNNVDCRRGC